MIASLGGFRSIINKASGGRVPLDSESHRIGPLIPAGLVEAVHMPGPIRSLSQ